MSWINNEVRPIEVSATEWWLKDMDTGAVVAVAHSIAGGLWRAELKKTLCAELINFLTVTGPSPKDALLGVFSENMRAIVDAARVLKNIDCRIDLAGFDEPQDVMAETIATAAV